MRRTTRRALVNLSLFGLALFVIISPNVLHPFRSSSKAFPWTTVRYKPSSPSLPDPRGICPGLVDATKPALVVSRVAADGDSGWLEPLLDKYHICVYNADAPTDPKSNHLQVPTNRGHEAMAYLTFIIDNYASIPPAGAVFVHGSRWAWHNDSPDYDNAALLAVLNVSAALEPLGYHNLRCDWSAGTCSRSEAPPQGSLETSLRAMTEPWNARVVSDKALPGSLAALFGGEAKLGRDDAVRAQCCAQFVVSRHRIRQHTREEYVALRQWLLDAGADTVLQPNGNAAPRDDRIAGRILSYVWHILFLSSPDGVDLDALNKAACPPAQECYCRLYGRCGLEHCTPGRCQGQYSVPQDYKLPSDWASTHS